MIPHIAKPGRSFQGAGLYYLHDKGALTSERVAFTHSENLHTQNAERAMKEMAFVAMDAERLKEQAGFKKGGRKGEYPVYHYSLAWHPDQEPSREERIEAARSSLKALGLEGYQAVFVAHDDESHAHIHIIVNRVHPDTGKMANLDFDRMRLSRWAERYEKEHGHIYCQQRVENNTRRRQGEYVKYRDPVIAVAWRRADSGKAFASALMEQGYSICRGERRDFVIMDAEGKIHNPARHIEGAKVKDIRERLKDLDPEQLFSLEEARARQQAMQEARQAQAKNHPRNAKTVTVKKTAYASHPDNPEFQNALEWKHIDERAILHDHYARRRAELIKSFDQTQRLDEQRRELAEIKQRQQATGYQAILRQLKGHEQRDRARAEALRQAIAQDKDGLEQALKAFDEQAERAWAKMEMRHEAEKQGRFEYEQVESRQKPLHGRGREYVPEPHLKLRPHMAPGYGAPTLGERQAQIIADKTKPRDSAAPPPAPYQTPLLDQSGAQPGKETARAAFQAADPLPVSQASPTASVSLAQAFSEAGNVQASPDELARWAREARKQLKTRQDAELMRLAREMAPMIAEIRRQIDAAYAPRLSTLERDILVIKARQTATGLKGHWERRQHSDDAQRLETLKGQLESVKADHQEALKVLEHERWDNEQVRELQRRHDQERQTEEERIARQISSGRLPSEAHYQNANGHEDDEEREQEHDRGRAPTGHGRGGRSRSR